MCASVPIHFFFVRTLRLSGDHIERENIKHAGNVTFEKEAGFLFFLLRYGSHTDIFSHGQWNKSRGGGGWNASIFSLFVFPMSPKCKSLIVFPFSPRCSI
jgi:hypothetical protein